MTFTDVLLALAPYLVPPIVAILGYLIMNALAKLPAGQRTFIQGIVTTAVSAVEQEAGGNLNSAGKKQLAVEFVEKELALWHINIPASVVSTMIEEAVLELNRFSSWSTPKKAEPAPAASSEIVVPLNATTEAK